ARTGTSRITNLERLRRAPSRASAPVLVQALARLTEVRQLDIGPLDLVNVPASRIKALAQYAVTTKAQNIANLTEQRRMATLVSFTRQLAVTAQDDSLDVLDMLIGGFCKTPRNGAPFRGVLQKPPKSTLLCDFQQQC